jgi:V/A-type H+-transporting ATPase subunit F
MSSKPHHSDSKGTIAVIGERELVIGYRLLGVDDTFIVNGGDESFKTMENLFFFP